MPPIIMATLHHYVVNGGQAVDKTLKNGARGLSLAGAARYIGISVPSFRRYVMDELPHRRVGSRRIYSVSIIDQWLEAKDEQDAL